MVNVVPPSRGLSAVIDPPMPLNHPVNDGQPQARAFARGFGGKKGFEDLIPDLRGNPTAGIGKAQNDPVSLGHGPAGDGDLPLAVHGVRGVEEQVGKDLLQLARVPDDLRQERVQVLDDLDVVEKGLVADEFHAAADDVIDVEEFAIPQGSGG